MSPEAHCVPASRRLWRRIFDWTQWHRGHDHQSPALVEEAWSSWNQLSGVFDNSPAMAPPTVRRPYQFRMASALPHLSFGLGLQAIGQPAINFPKRFPRWTTDDGRRHHRDANFGASCVHHHRRLEAGTTHRNFARGLAHATPSIAFHMAIAASNMTRATSRGGRATRKRMSYVPPRP
jgi:hypothetical protein